jgi:hypothetical protein
VSETLAHLLHAEADGDLVRTPGTPLRWHVRPDANDPRRTT